MAVNNENVLSQTRVIHDARSTTSIIFAALIEHPFPSIYAVLTCVVMMVFPGAFLFGSLIVLLAYIFYKNKSDTLPFFLPHSARNTIDTNNPKIGKKGFNKPQGHIFWGNVMATGEQLWAKFESALRHILVLGTTGAGKTETLLGILSNFFAVGGGGLYNDGKGTVKLYYQIFSIARYFGREDDVLCVNYTKENTSERPDPAAHISHTIAPFSFGSADNNIQQTTSLMPEDSGSSNKVFSEGAIALISSVMPAMCDLRELGLMKISPKKIRQYTNYIDYCKLLRNPMISELSREAMLGFLRTRSGYDDKKPADEQPDEVTKQWGFNQAYFARALQMLSDSFANIYMYDTGEVDYRDVILNDRVLVSILPSMSKSTEDMAQLGKMNLFAIRSALSLGLGGAMEGTVEDVLDNVTSTDRPSICINDEISFYLAKGFMITAAQARSLMMVMLFSSQEFASIKKASETEAEQLWANTRWKFIMASEGDNETFTRFQQLAGKVWAYVRTGLKASGNAIGNPYVGNDSINLQQVDKLTIEDLREMDEGEALCFYQTKMVKTRMFYHGVEKEHYVSQLRILSCPDPVIEPPRGPYKTILSNENYQMLLPVRDWLKNLQAGDTDDSKTMINPSKATQVALRMETYLAAYPQELRALNTAERGLAMINSHNNALRIMEAFNNKDEVGASKSNEYGGLLSNISGSFGNDDFENQSGIINANALSELDELIEEGAPQSENEIISNLISKIDSNKAAAFDSVLDFLNDDEDQLQPPTLEKPVTQKAATKAGNADNASSNPGLSPLSSLTRNDDDDEESHFALFSPELAEDSLIDSQDVPNLLENGSYPFAETRVAHSSDFLPSNIIKRIAVSTASLESILGTPPNQAKLIANTTVEQIVKAVEYPKTKIKPSKDKLDVIKGILDAHINKTLK